jgi:hypothetical protein
MGLIPCPREKEISAALASGHWPRAVSVDLLAHYRACSRCGELLLVSQAFRQTRNATVSQASLPAPEMLWWRAQLRLRAEAVQKLERPLLGAQLFTLALTLAAAALLVASQIRRGVGLQPWANWQDAQPLAPAWQETARIAASCLDRFAHWPLALLVPSLSALALFVIVALVLASPFRTRSSFHLAAPLGSNQSTFPQQQTAKHVNLDDRDGSRNFAI